MVFFATRRARLRPESASLYPEIAPGIWVSARAATLTVHRANVRHERPVESSERSLPNAHFDFRGGRRQRRDGPDQPTRATDRVQEERATDPAPKF
jgi:hypothetical protein